MKPGTNLQPSQTAFAKVSQARPGFMPWRGCYFSKAGFTLRPLELVLVRITALHLNQGPAFLERNDDE